jgi:hypothetical protein
MDPTLSVLDVFAEWLRATPLSVAFQNQVAWLWPLCESLHFIGLCLLIGAAGLLDLRLLGFMKTVPVWTVKRFIQWAMVGFALNLATGLVFLISQPQQYVTNPSMWLKGLFLLVAGGNALLFEVVFSRKVAILGAGEDTPAAVKVIALVSLASWFAVLYFGRMIPYLVPDPTSGV